MKEIFELKEPSYSLPSQGNYLVCRNVKTTGCDFQSIKYLAPKTWDRVPDRIEHSGSLT